MGNPFRSMRGGATPPAIKVAFDRFGKPLEPGQIVMFHPDVDLCFEVVDVRPVLNPSMPQGAMQITLQCAPFAFPVQPGGRDSRIVMVGLTAERQKAEAELAASNGGGHLHAVDDYGDEVEEVDEAKDPRPMASLLCPACNHIITSAFVKVGDPCEKCGDAKYIEAL